MDTCLILTHIDPKAVDAGFKKAREYLLRFSFLEDQSEAYKRSIYNASQRWNEFLKAGLCEDLAALLNRPYQWLSLAGKFVIDNNDHGIEFFLYPILGTKATVSVCFSESVYEAVYSFKPSYEQEIDLNVKQDILGLFLLMARSFSPSAFALRPVISDEDLISSISDTDIKEWLIAPTEESLRHWRFLLVGIRTGMVERQQVEKKWPPKRVMQSSAGYLIYDGIV
jgi:hypothetical protein